MTIIGKPIYFNGSVPYTPKTNTVAPLTRTGVITSEARKVISGNPYQPQK